MRLQYAVLNDIHFPYENRRLYAKALKKIKTWDNLAGIYLNGDILEVESLSRHPKGPQAVTQFKREIDYANKRFDEIQNLFPDVPVLLIEGNHCYRLFRYIRDVAPQMWGLLEHPTLLKFDERGWRFIPYGPKQWWRCGKTDLWLRHEPLKGGVNCSRQTAMKSDVDVLFGHTHMYQQSVVNRMGPIDRKVRAISGGWIGDKSQSIFDYRGNSDDWCEGFSEVICLGGGKYEHRFHYL